MKQSHQQENIGEHIEHILGDPGAASGSGEKSKTGEKKIRTNVSSLDFFSARFRLFPAPTKVPEDA